MRQHLQLTNMPSSSAGINHLRKPVNPSGVPSIFAGSTTIVGRTARLLREWLKPSSHISRSGPTCLAITLTGEEIAELVHENHQPEYLSVS